MVNVLVVDIATLCIFIVFLTIWRNNYLVKEKEEIPDHLHQEEEEGHDQLPLAKETITMRGIEEEKEKKVHVTMKESEEIENAKGNVKEIEEGTVLTEEIEVNVLREVIEVIEIVKTEEGKDQDPVIDVIETAMKEEEDTHTKEREKETDPLVTENLKKLAK